MRKRLLLAVAALVPVLVVTGVALAGGIFGEARKATGDFRDIEAAKAAGYTVRVADLAGIECIQSAEGTMGIHMLNPDLLFDGGKIEETKPELLVYEPGYKGRMKLVALEYLVFKDAWTGSSPPELFGKEFDLTPAGNRYGLPDFYALHAWIFRDNPSGDLAPYNPKVDCEPGR
jgi:hypothetical protein